MQKQYKTWTLEGNPTRFRRMNGCELGRKHMQDSYRELLEERDHVKNLLV